jgi:hypothetical protein
MTSFVFCTLKYNRNTIIPLEKIKIRHASKSIYVLSVWFFLFYFMILMFLKNIMVFLCWETIILFEKDTGTSRSLANE